MGDFFRFVTFTRTLFTVSSGSSHHHNSIVRINIQTLTIGARKCILYGKIYWPEAITTMFFLYAMKVFVEQLN